jgi:hypothetical protein
MRSFLPWAALVAATPAWAQSLPDHVHFEGRVLDATGQPVTGQRDMQFDAFEAITGGTALWSQDLSGVTVTDGYFSVDLPVASPPGALGTPGARFLEVTVGTDVLAPRQPIAAVPYAASAGAAHSLTGAAATAFTSLSSSVGGLQTSVGTLQTSVGTLQTSVGTLQTTLTNAQEPYASEGTLGHIGASGMCAGLLGSWGYGQMRVVRSNGSSCNSACDSQDTGGGPYTNYYCYGSVSLDTVQTAPRTANQLVASGWFGRDYCDSTNGMATFCCCKANYPNTK